jgi:hypothetical protein
MYSYEQVSYAADGTQPFKQETESVFTLSNRVKLSKVRTWVELKRNRDQ